MAVGGNNRISTAGYVYDAAGNMTSDGLGHTYTYDQENRIAGAAGYTYTYDADGNRVKKANGSDGTLYWYMTSGIVAESDLVGALKSEYVFFGGERVARRDLVAPAGVFYYFSDHLKTASVIADSAGGIKAESDYYPWGGELQFVNADSNHYKFTDKERDLESGLDYFGARYYANQLGRWVSADWSGVPVPVPYADLGDPQSLNLYTYVRNIPTSNADIDGHELPIVNNPKALQDLGDRFSKTLPAVERFFKHPAVQAYLSLLFFGEGGAEGGAEGAAEGAAAATTKGAGEAGVSANAAKGAAFERNVVNATKATDHKVAEQVTLKTQSGVKTRVDAVSKKTSGEVRLQEAKSSATAPLTKNQKLAHPEIEKSGATVVGKGKPEYPGGTRIPPTKVEVVRPNEPKR
jgi:RHS repeat-associated protein